MTEDDIISFLNQHNYDLKLKQKCFSRWIDQKCTPDVLWSVSDYILNYVDNVNSEFTSRDIWNSDYARDLVKETYSKPSTTDSSASHEYDKFFAQQLNLLCYSGVIDDISTNSNHKYIVRNKSILKFIATNEMNALYFLRSYIEKVLTDTGIMQYFDVFFIEQTQESYQELKDKFAEFYHIYTPVCGKFEPNRIFTKVLNPLAHKRGKQGSIGGRISKQPITKSDLMYNQNNFRDIYMRKPKNMSRQDFIKMRGENISTGFYKQQLKHAQDLLRENIEYYRSNISELTQFDDDYTDCDVPSHIHHIFPKSEYPEIMSYPENMIALTPNQHLNKAHPNGCTQTVNKKVQEQCLVAKVHSIQYNVCNSQEDTIYDFSNLLNVIQVGFDVPDDEILTIEKNDFDSVLRVIEKYCNSSQRCLY